MKVLSAEDKQRTVTALCNILQLANCNGADVYLTKPFIH